MMQLAGLLSKEPSGREEAIGWFRQVLVLKPGKTNAMANLAFMLQKQASGRQEAEALYREVLVREPQNIGVLHNFAGQLSKEPSGREEAITLYGRVLALEPDNVTTLNRLGYLLSMDPERLDEADQLLRRSLELDPEHGYARPYLGAMLSARGSADAFAEALQMCESAVEDTVGKGGRLRAHAAAALGIVLLRSGDTASAREKLDEAREHCGKGYPTTLMESCRNMLQ